VTATDLAFVISSVLSHQTIEIKELDWSVPPVNWVWDHPSIIASHSATSDFSGTRPDFDLIVSADTVYSPALVTPLLRTIHALSTLRTITLLAIERRDPSLVDSLLKQAAEVWFFRIERIPHKKMVKAMTKAGLKWDPLDYEGVEIWKLTLKETEHTSI
jgi:protein N-lysine methyltransferase METTL21D